MAHQFGQQFVDSFLIPHLARPLGVPPEDHQSLLQALAKPAAALQVLYAHYAFSRRGKHRDELVAAAQEALAKTLVAQSLHDGSDTVWHAFVVACQSRHIKATEAQDRGIVQGLFELAAETDAANPGESIVSLIVRTINETGKIEDIFARIVDIRGLGPKSTSTFIRDIVHLYGLEPLVEPAEKIHIQPVDRWLRLLAAEIVPEDGMDKAADWVIAGKVSKYCRRAGASSILFSMGCTYFGQRIVRDVERFDYEIRKLKQSLA